MINEKNAIDGSIYDKSVSSYIFIIITKKEIVLYIWVGVI